MAPDLASYRAFIAAFSVTDSKSAFDGGYYVPLPDSLAARIRARAEIQPDAAQAIVGGIGFGKTTQLLAAASALREVEDVEVRYVDVASRHEVSILGPSLLLTLAGLELIEALPAGRANPKVRKHLRDHANGHWDVQGDPDGEPLEPWEVWVKGVLQDPNPIAPSVAWIEDEVRELASALGKHLVLILDGLDRAQDMPMLIAMLGQDLRAFKRLGIGCVYALPEQMLFGKERAFLDQLDWHPLTAFDVHRDAAGRELFEQVLARRAPPDLVTAEAAGLLVTLSGGVFRDLIVLARNAGEEAYMAGAASIAPTHVEQAADRFARKRLFGLSQDQLRTLQRLRKGGVFVATSDSDVTLVSTGCVLQYATPSSRFEVHPMLVPLLRSLERAA